MKGGKRSHQEDTRGVPEFDTIHLDTVSTRKSNSDLFSFSKPRGFHKLSASSSVSFQIFMTEYSSPIPSNNTHMPLLPPLGSFQNRLKNNA